MARYTDVEKRLAELEEKEKAGDIEWHDYVIITVALENAPTADVVEVVRCKDCWKRDDEDFCPLVSDSCYPPKLSDDWFCKDGERKSDD